METTYSDAESSEQLLGDWDFLLSPPPTRVDRGGSTSTVGRGRGRVLPPWADPSYQWGGGKWKEDGRKNRKNKKTKEKEKKKESDLRLVEDLMKEYASLPPQIAEWYWCIEFVAKYVKALPSIFDVMNMMGFPTTNDYGSRINELLSLRILDYLFDPTKIDADADAAAAPVVFGPRFEFDLSLSSTHVLHAILKQISVSEIRPGMPELSNFNLIPFLAHKNMSLPPCALEMLRDLCAMENQTSAAPTMEANDPLLRDRRDVCEGMAIDEEQVHTCLEQTNMKDKDNVLVIDHEDSQRDEVIVVDGDNGTTAELLVNKDNVIVIDDEDSPPLQRDEVIVIDGGNDTTAEQLINKGNTTRETSSPSLDVRVKDGSDDESDTVKDPPSSRPENLCWKCEREGGAFLLICSRSECATKVHKECLNGPAPFDEHGNFLCPICWCGRVTMEYHESQKLMYCAKRKLGQFLPLLSRASKRLRR